MQMRHAILDPSKIDPNKNNAEARALIDLIQTLDTDPTKTLKITKSKGEKKGGGQREKPGYPISDNTEVHLKDFSLIRFPNTDRYYVIGKTLGEGGLGKVKLLPIYFTLKDGLSGKELTRHEDPNREEIIKILKNKGKKRKDVAAEAQKEVDLAKAAGGHKEVAAGFKQNDTTGEQTGYAKMPKASGMDLEKYLLSHRDMSLKERLNIIKMIMTELQKIREKGYFYTDIKPDNIFYDGKNITFVDWGSVATKENKPFTPIFASIAEEQNEFQREAYALAGLIGVILSDFTEIDKIVGKEIVYNIDTYVNTPVLKPKKEKAAKISNPVVAASVAQQTDYDFSKITPSSFNLPKNSVEANAFVVLVENLKKMGNMDVKERDQILQNNYQTFMDNLNLISTKLWLKPLVEDLEKSLSKSSSKEDPKHKAIRALIQFEKDLGNKSLDMDELRKILEEVIATSAAKQEGKMFKSNVLNILKNHLPPDISNLLSNQEQLKKYQSASVFRMFGKEKEKVDLPATKLIGNQPPTTQSKQSK